MSIFNQTFLPIMQKNLAQLRDKGKNEFYTTDVIKEYIGHYNADVANVHDSINANIGKFLGENMTALGIKEKAPNQPVVDDNGFQSQASLWVFTAS